MQSKRSEERHQSQGLPTAEVTSPGLITHGHRIWFQWTLGTFLALTAPLLVADLFAFLMVGGREDVVFCCDNSIGVWLVFAFFLVVLPGPLLGIAQSRVLSRLLHFRRAKAWAVVMVIAFIIVEITLMAQRFSISLDATGLVVALVPGAVIGLAQFTLLRKVVRGARWWIPVNAFALAAAGTAGALVGTALATVRWSNSSYETPFYPLDTLLYWIIGWATTASVFAVLTGYAMEWLFRSPKAQTDEDPGATPQQPTQAPIVP